MKYYAVKNGRVPGIYNDWNSCKEQVDGYSGALYKSFTSRKQAEEYITGTENEHKIEEGTVAYVDGSYRADTKEYSFGAVLFSDGKTETFSQKFSNPDMASMRNVAGEIMGAEFIMRLCTQRGIKSVTIRYDYAGIEAWATGVWQTNKDGTCAYKRYYDSIKDILKVTFEKVKGHSGDKYNDMADSLAKQALGIVQ